MAESTMQYLVSLTDEVAEMILKLQQEWHMSRDAVIEQAIHYFYQSNQKPEPKRPQKETLPLRDVASSIAMALLQRTLDEGGTIKIPSLGITIGPKDAE